MLQSQSAFITMHQCQCMCLMHVNTKCAYCTFAIQLFDHTLTQMELFCIKTVCTATCTEGPNLFLFVIHKDFKDAYAVSKFVLDEEYTIFL